MQERGSERMSTRRQERRGHTQGSPDRREDGIQSLIKTGVTHRSTVFII